jgi:Ser/Thr protein kinase RdoA (MazF antagonist)
MFSATDDAPERLPSPCLSGLVRRWFPEGGDVRPLPRGGFSGGPLWLVEADAGRFVLKAFPAGFDPARAAEVHRQMRRARVAGVMEVPAVRGAAGGASLESEAGRLWEMVAFVEGEPAPRPRPAQVKAAVAVLARIHAAVDDGGIAEPSPAVAGRVAAAQRMLKRPWASLLPAVDAAEPAALAWVAGQRLARACAAASQKLPEMLMAIAARSPAIVRRQWVLRDVWSDHVLFGGADGSRVVGVIDYHAAGFDTPAADCGRLLGSWMEPEATAVSWWAERLTTYEAVRPLGDSERRLVPFLAASSVLFGLDNWFRWTIEEGRQFGSSSQVAARLDRLLESLPIALDVLENAGLGAGLTAEKCSS